MPRNITWYIPVPLCSLPILGIDILFLLLFFYQKTGNAAIYCRRNQKPVPMILSLWFCIPYCTKSEFSIKNLSLWLNFQSKTCPSDWTFLLPKNGKRCYLLPQESKTCPYDSYKLLFSVVKIRIIYYQNQRDKPVPLIDLWLICLFLQYFTSSPLCIRGIKNLSPWFPFLVWLIYHFKRSNFSAFCSL